MTDYLFRISVSAVFGVVWLTSQDWFEFLPRRVTRRISTVSLLILVSTWALASSAFQEGLSRFVAYAVTQAQGRMQDVFDDIYDPTTPPSPTPLAPSPAVR